MDKIKLGVIGLGNMGLAHLRNYAEGKMPEIEITCVADIDERKFEKAKERAENITCFNSADELIKSGMCNAVLIVTSHYTHPEIAIKALSAGLHVMSEKPAGVYTKQVRELNEFSKTVDKTFAIMFNQRTNCVYRKVKELVSSGNYGEIMRVSWIITDWYRPQQYYNSGGWRATWRGEGGGVLLNQCPHQLDLWQWICGMPSKVKAICHEGKWHDIEVEDDVTIYVEYPNGATGTFIAGTGDCPGTNRLEITMDKAKIVCEFNQINQEYEIWIYELDESIKSNIQTSTDSFKAISGKWKKVETDGKNEQHIGVMNAFAGHIIRGEPLVAEGIEGINGLTISNAVYLSSWLDKTIELPIDEDLYLEMLNEKIKNSRFQKTVNESITEDMSSTY